MGDSKSIHKSTPIRISIFVIGASLAFWIIWILFFQPKSTTYHARKIMGAYANSNAGTVYSYSLEEERTLAHITPQNVRQIQDKIINPLLEKYMSSTDVSTEGSDRSMIGSFRLRNDQGRTIDFGVQVYSHNGNAKILVTQGIYNAWICQYVLDHNVAPSLENTHLAIIEGLGRDRSFLEQAGILGIVTPHPQEGRLELRTFESIAQRQADAMSGFPAKSDHR